MQENIKAVLNANDKPLSVNDISKLIKDANPLDVLKTIRQMYTTGKVKMVIAAENGILGLNYQLK
jgi:predicted Zn-ribbon and HTH transcriptional regulator